MNRYLKLCMTLFLAAVILFTPGCARKPAVTTNTTIEVTDQLSRTVILEKNPQRIISLSPANTEILYALGLADRIVGVTDYCNYPPEAKQKESIGGFSTPNLEKVVSLAPDLIVAAPIHMKQVLPQLETKGLKAIAIAPRTLDDVMAAVTIIGKVTGTENRAADLVSQMRKRIKAVTGKTEGLSADKRPKVLFVVWHDPFMASGTKTFHDELITKAGGVNAVGNLENYATINLEVVVDTNPAVIIAGVGMGQGMDAPFEFVKNETRLRDIDARKNDRIFKINSDLSDRAGPRIIDALEQFARMIHPELFK